MTGGFVYETSPTATGLIQYTSLPSHSFLPSLSDNSVFTPGPSDRALIKAIINDSPTGVNSRSGIRASLPIGYEPTSGNTSLISAGVSSSLGAQCPKSGDAPGPYGLPHGAMFIMVQYDEPTPGAYTYDAGTNLNIFHHCGAVQNMAIAKSASATATNLSPPWFDSSVSVSCDYSLEWELGAYYFTRPIDRAKFYDGVAANAPISLIPGSTAFTTSLTVSEGDSLVSFIEGYASKGHFGAPDAGYTLTERSRVYGALIYSKLKKNAFNISMSSTMNSFLTDSVGATALFANAGTAKLTWTADKILTPQAWVDQVSY